MDPTGLLGMQLLQQDVQLPDGSAGQQSLMLCLSPSRKYFRGIASHINNCIQVGAGRWVRVCRRLPWARCGRAMQAGGMAAAASTALS
jgi:hypothetical protein